MKARDMLVVLGFALAWSFTAYFTGKILGAYLTGHSAIIFDFNLYGEFVYEAPLFTLIFIVSTVAFFLMFMNYARGRKNEEEN